MFKICIVIFFLVSMCFSQQTDALKQKNLSKGEEVIRKAKDAAGLSQSITSFQVKLRAFGHHKMQGLETTIDTQVEITVSPANKIRILSVFKNGGLNRRIWNQTKFRETAEFDSDDGQRHVVDTTNGIQLNQNVLSATKSKKSDIKSPDSKAAAFSDDLWEMVFPLIFNHPLESSAKFEYVGRAQAGEQIANFVQTTSASGRTIQLFFDEKTNDLLLMIEKFKKPGRDFERKLYYSNRENRNGVVMPTKIKIEHKITVTGQPPLTLYEYVDLLGFEPNPTIKPEIFKVN